MDLRFRVQGRVGIEIATTRDPPAPLLVPLPAGIFGPPLSSHGFAAEKSAWCHHAGQHSTGQLESPKRVFAQIGVRVVTGVCRGPRAIADCARIPEQHEGDREQDRTAVDNRFHR